MDTPGSPARRAAADPSRLTFEDFARQRDAELDVALGAALVSRDAYPDLDVSGVLHEIDRLAAPLFGAHLEKCPADEQASVLGELLYGVQRFRGNEADYYDPKNSLIADVLRRRLGIPLTLAIVYCEVARRVGVQAHGVGFPGHFLVRIDRSGRAPLIVDPFFSGRPLQEDELRARLGRVLGPDQREDLAAHLAPASPRAILVRMLTNLKAIYLTRNERARAHLAVDRIASLLPHAAGPVVERALLAVQLGAHESARSDFSRALTLQPTDSEERAVRAELAKLGGKPSSLN